MPYQIDNRPPDLREQLYFPEILKGIGFVTRNFLKNLFFTRDANPDVLARDRRLSQNATLQYPEERQPYPPGYRGLHRLVPREDGRARCVACYMCATACPAQCIYIEAGEVEGDPIEKYPVKFVIDELRCIVCGFCVEACVGEITNMITGGAKRRYESLGLDIDLARPEIYVGRDQEMSFSQPGASIVLPFTTDNGSLVVEFFFK